MLTLCIRLGLCFARSMPALSERDPSECWRARSATSLADCTPPAPGRLQFERTGSLGALLPVEANRHACCTSSSSVKTRPRNSNRHLRTGIKIALGFAIVLALLLFGMRKVSGGASVLSIAQIEPVVDRGLLDPEYITSRRASAFFDDEAAAVTLSNKRPQLLVAR